MGCGIGVGGVQEVNRPDGRKQVGLVGSGWKRSGKQSSPTEEKLAGRGIGVEGGQEAV